MFKAPVSFQLPNEEKSSEDGVDVESEDAKDVRATFRFEGEELKTRIALWKEEGRPVQLLQRDHFSAKVLEDNTIFERIKFHGHEYKFDDKGDLMILYKKSPNPVPEYERWEEILNKNYILRTRWNEFVIQGLNYGEDGLSRDDTFRFPPSEFEWHMQKWLKEGWPVQFLVRDHYGAKILFDNQVWQYMEFYGHGYKWDEEEGLFILFRETLGEKPVWRAWNDIVDLLTFQRTSAGYLLWDGWNYDQDGLGPGHLWQWKTLLPSYTYPSTKHPSYCYADFMTCSWEHKGLPGLGVDGVPQGHNMMEFGDDQGVVYSVGMYMDPRSLINTKATPAAVVKAVLFSPDQYFAARGEKSIHRYYLGKGSQGRKQVDKLKKHLESIQNFKRHRKGQITCSSRKYQAITDNCGTFSLELEKFVQEELKGELIKFSPDEVLLPFRQRVDDPSIRSWRSWFWNVIMLSILDVLLFLLIMTPGLKKKLGVGVHDDFSDHDALNRRYANQVKSSSFKPKFDTIVQSIKRHRVLTPRRQRLHQLYSPRLRNYTVVFNTLEGKKD